MQTTYCRDWISAQLMTTAQMTSEFGHCGHLQASFGRLPHSEIFNASCFHGRHHQPTPTSYVEQVRREWIANYVSHQRLKQLECWSEVDDSTAGTVSAVGKHSASCGRWSGNIKDAQTRSRDIKDQLSNGSYIRLVCLLV